jgi:hypothetical protein
VVIHQYSGLDQQLNTSWFKFHAEQSKVRSS